MKNMLLTVMLTLSLLVSGCSTTSQIKDVQVMEKYKYVITEVPKEYFELPPQVDIPKINPSTGKIMDKDVAKFMVDLEKRGVELEVKISELKKFLDEKIRNLKVPKEDIVIIK